MLPTLPELEAEEKSKKKDRNTGMKQLANLRRGRVGGEEVQGV